MNSKESILEVLQELKVENPNFFCSPPLHILTWKSKKIEGALITKIDGRRYLGLLRKDSIGQDYWKYQPLKTSDSDSSESPAISALDNIAKFRQRQEKTEQINHGESNSESINS